MFTQTANTSSKLRALAWRSMSSQSCAGTCALPAAKRRFLVEGCAHEASKGYRAVGFGGRLDSPAIPSWDVPLS